MTPSESLLEGRTLREVPVEISEPEVLRLLGKGPGRRRPRLSVMTLVEEERAWCLGALQPRALTLGCPEGLPGSAYLAPGKAYVLGLCTLGSELDERLRELTASGQVARALVLDALGSTAVEEVADRANHEICSQGHGQGLLPDRRVSPGYGGWALEEQGLLFEYLAPEDLGVALGDGMMMEPVKSISFAVPLFGGEGAGLPMGARCRRCGMPECEFREEDR